MSHHLALMVVVALIIPVSVNFLINGSDLLGRIGERAAMLAVAANMPDAGLDLLQQRFHDALYADELEEHDPVVPHEPKAEKPAASSEEETPADPDLAPSQSPPNIPESYRGALLSENFAAAANSEWIRYGAGHIRNETRYDDEDIYEILETPMSLVFEDTDEPQVLIVHTHATESFEQYDTDVYDTRNTWRSVDNNKNMVAVGDELVRVLEENGIGVIHDTTQHDYPSYNGSYERSAETVQQYLDEYPTIKVVLDLHRDAMEREGGAIVKPVTVIDGQKSAQIMIIAGCDDGTMNMPDWRENLRFAAALQDAIESRYTDLTRPVYFCYRKYNQDLAPGLLLIEFGSNANTLNEAVYAAQMAGQALAELIRENTQ